MENRLTQEQLTKVVAEVQRLSLRREDEVDREQVKEILLELNLSPDLLDDALVQVQRREALSVQQGRDRWIIGGVAIVLVGAIATTTIFNQNRQREFANISGSQSRITLASDGSAIATISRQTNPEIYYRVTLQKAPIGEKLSLKCNWIEPSGRVVHQNSYDTKPITKEIWDTQCRYRLDSTAPTGSWETRMLLGDRVLETTTFVVK